MKEFNGFMCLNGTDMKERLGLSVSAAEIEELGNVPYAREKSAKFWRLADLNKIIESIKAKLDLAKEPA